MNAARHRTAISQSLSWARDAADGGDYVEALKWMDMLDAIGHTLAPEDQTANDSWRAAVVAANPHSGR